MKFKTRIWTNCWMLREAIENFYQIIMYIWSWIILFTIFLLLLDLCLKH